MRRIALFFCLLMAMVAVDAAAETQQLNFTNFDEVSVGSGMRLSISQGNAYQVTATGSADDLRRLEVRQNGSRLEFSIPSGFLQLFRSTGSISLDIRLPVLRRLGLSGGSEASLTVQTGSQSFTAELSGGSALSGRLTGGDIDLVLSGGSRASLSGSGKDLSLTGSGGSKYELKNLTVGDVSATLSGGSEATVTVNGRVDSTLSGGSEVIYYGNAVQGASIASGGSRVRKGS